MDFSLSEMICQSEISLNSKAISTLKAQMPYWKDCLKEDFLRKEFLTVQMYHSLSRLAGSRNSFSASYFANDLDWV